MSNSSGKISRRFDSTPTARLECIDTTLGYQIRTRRLHVVACICWLTLIGVCRAAAAGGELGSRVDAFRKEKSAIIGASADAHDWSDHTDELEAAYRRWFPADSLAALIENADQSELSEFFYETLNHLIDVGIEPEELRLEIVFGRLEEKGWADDRVVEAMHQYLLTFRLFDRAEAFRQEHPRHGLPAPPPIVPLSSAPEEHLRTVLAVNDDGSALKRQAVDLRSSSKVIVIGSPNCHFARDAVAAIASDPQLSRSMSAAAVWLAGPFESLTDGAMPEWNRKNPAFAYRHLEFKSAWPEVNYWGTPSFYFIKDGELVKKVVGWPKDAAEERKQALRAGFRAIGIGEEH